MGTIWKGAISFGLVNIPVRVESATKDTSPKFRMLDGKDNMPIKTVRVRQADEKPVEYKMMISSRSRCR
jgi:DNA end-binding protein Ku